MSSSSEKQARHTKSSSHSSRNSISHSAYSSRSNSTYNEEEENETSQSDSNSASENSGEEGILQQIDSMPSLDSEFLMSPNNNFPNFSQNSNVMSDKDNKNYDNNSENDSSDEKNSNHFPSILPDELPIIDPSPTPTDNKNPEFSSSSGSYSNTKTRSISIDIPQITENSSTKNEEGQSKSKKIEAPTKKRMNTVLPFKDRPSNIPPLNPKSKFGNFTKDDYAYDFENDDDEGDPSSNLPMPMQMTALPESPSKRRQTLPLRRSSFMESNQKPLQKVGSSNKIKFRGYIGMDECEQTLLKKCHKCSKKIKKDGVFINGWYYHRKCLICSKCGKSISQQKKCYMYHEELMCDECVHINLNEISICGICGQKIFNNGEKIDLPNGQKVHSKCLSCYICGKHLSLKDAQIIEDDNGDDSHPPSKISKGKSKRHGDADDNDSSFSSKQKKKKNIKDRRTSNFNCDTIVPSNDGIKMIKYVCRHCHSFLMKEQVCNTCGRPVLENIVIKNQRVFHRQCFRCEHKGCNTQLFGNSYVIHHNQFLCWEHGKIYSISCAYCKQMFKNYETDRIKWHSKLYHKHCFVCRVCGCNLDPQACKSVHGRPHCEKCFQIRVNEGDCDEKGKSFYVHYNQHHRKKSKKTKKSVNVTFSNDKDIITLEEEEEEEINKEEEESESITSVDMNENLKKKHDTHLHIAKKAFLRKNRFQTKYNVDIYWPEYCEKVTFEKAEPYKPEEDKNVFKKF